MDNVNTKTFPTLALSRSGMVDSHRILSAGLPAPKKHNNCLLFALQTKKVS